MIKKTYPSERSLCNWVKKPEKNSGLQQGLNPWPDDTGAMLYQLSYEATDVGSRSIYFISAVQIWFISYIIKLISFTGTYEPTIDLLPTSVAS